MTDSVLGINGLGRIGKLTVWQSVLEKTFRRLVVNTGRPVGRRVQDLVQYLESDSTYGNLGAFLHGAAGPRHPVGVLREDPPVLEIEGVEVRLLTRSRNPREISWAEHGVSLVVDTTGRFRDPTVPPDHPGGSLRGHLDAGARTVVVSAAFKAKGAASWPDDAVMLIQGINQHAFDPARHCLVSAASCTTTALAHMMLPLLEHRATRRMLTASMSTIHAATNTQPVLDRVPASGARDLRKTRSVLNNIILTSTNAAQALEHVVPEIRGIGFLADSVRVPVPTASLIILNCTFQAAMNEDGTSSVSREVLNEIYRDFARLPGSGVVYSEGQNVSTDMIGEPAAVVIEAAETHTRTGFLTVDPAGLGLADASPIEVPVTHAKIFGWYDNELGSYCRRMLELVRHITARRE